MMFVKRKLIIASSYAGFKRNTAMFYDLYQVNANLS
jgi:hypothetical protein